MKAVITIGRMNPPTAGHLYLISKVLEEPADIYALVLQGGNLKDKDFKNIFSQAVKADIIKASDLKDISKLIIIDNVDYFPKIAEKLGLTKEDEMIIILGEEDVGLAEKNFTYLNQTEKEQLPKIEFRGIPMKSANSEERISGTLIRKFIFSNDFENFYKYFGISDKEKARKVFQTLRSEVISNLKNRFPHREENGKLIFDLPKHQKIMKGKLNAAAKLAIDSILSKLKGYDKEIFWENNRRLNENGEESWFNAGTNDADYLFIVTKKFWIVYDAQRCPKYAWVNGNKKRLNYSPYPFHEDVLDACGIDFNFDFDKINFISGRIWKKSNRTSIKNNNPQLYDLVGVHNNMKEINKFPFFANVIDMFIKTPKFYLDADDVDGGVADEDIKEISKYIHNKSDFSVSNKGFAKFSSHAQDPQKNASDIWRRKIYGQAGVWENTIKQEEIHDMTNDSHEIMSDNVEVIPQPSTEMTYIDLMNPINLPSQLVSSFERSKRIFPSKVVSTDGNEIERIGKYETGTWERFKRSILSNGFTSPIIVRINDDLSCRIHDGHHRLHAMNDIKYDRPTIPVAFSIADNVNFRALNHLFKSWNDESMIDNRDYASLLNQLNLLRVEDVIKIPKQIKVLNEGGAAGHMAHGYEVFKGKEIFKFFDDLFSGKYEMYEKVDGQNVQWGISKDSGQAIFDLGGKIGKIKDVEEKYSLYHPAGDAYRAGFQAVREAVERISPSMIRALGLLDGNMINSEIIYGEIPNVIPYSKTVNYIVLHNIKTNNEFVENEKFLLNRLAEDIGEVLVTSPVVNYEGEDLSDIKASITQETSKWKFVGPMKIDIATVKEKLGDVIENWKEYPEAKRLNSKEQLSDEEAFELAKSLSVKISSEVLNKMISQLREPDAEKIQGIPGIEGIALYDKDKMYKVTGDFALTNRTMWKPIEKVKEIEREYFRFLAQDILGLKTMKVGEDFISRFNSDPVSYLQMKSPIFAKKRGMTPENPNSSINVNMILNKTDEVINELQVLYQQISVSDNVKKQSIIRSIKLVAFKIARMRKLLQHSKTYSDVVIASAKGQDLMEGLYKKDKKEILSEKLIDIEVNAIIQELKSHNIEANRIRQIIQFLKAKGSELSHEIINKIYALIKRNDESYDWTIQFIKSLHLPEIAAKEITEKIFEFGEEDVEIIINYLKNRTVTLEDLKKSNHILELFKKTKINENFLMWLTNYSYQNIPAVGSGEIALVLLLNGGSKAGVGDVTVNGLEIEVKGDGGRIKGQKGYSMGMEAGRYLSDVIKANLTKIDPKKRPIKIEQIPEPGSNAYNFGKTNIDSNIFNMLAPIFIENNVLKKADIVKAIQASLKRVFHGMDISWVARHVNNMGQIKNSREFIDDWFRASVKYYFDTEHFDLLVILDRKGKLACVSKEEDPLTKLKISSVPSFTTAASVQGATFAVKV